MPFLTIWETGILYITENRNFIQLRKQEYCTSLKTGILYINENRNFVQPRKQEFCTTQKTGILYITYVHPLFSLRSIYQRLHQYSFMLPWTLNACSNVSKCQISIDHTWLLNALNICVPLIQFTIGFMSVILYVSMGSKCMQWCYKINEHNQIGGAWLLKYTKCMCSLDSIHTRLHIYYHLCSHGL